MKLPPDSVISDRKLKEYLLSPRVEDDKSRFLAIAGYTPSHWSELEADLRDLIGAKDADLTRSTVYGDMYEVKGSLVGPNGKDPSGNHRVDTADGKPRNPVCQFVSG